LTAAIPVKIGKATARQLLEAIYRASLNLEERMTELDAATERLTATVDVVVALLPQISALQAQVSTLTTALEVAGLDDADAAAALVDLQENLTSIDAQTQRLADASGVSAPPEDPPADPPVEDPPAAP
jgi:chromosome segregation ATPase